MEAPLSQILRWKFSLVWQKAILKQIWNSLKNEDGTEENGEKIWPSEPSSARNGKCLQLRLSEKLIRTD